MNFKKLLKVLGVILLVSKRTFGVLVVHTLILFLMIYICAAAVGGWLILIPFVAIFTISFLVSRDIKL